MRKFLVRAAAFATAQLFVSMAFFIGAAFALIFGAPAPSTPLQNTFVLVASVQFGVIFALHCLNAFVETGHILKREFNAMQRERLPQYAHLFKD